MEWLGNMESQRAVAETDRATACLIYYNDYYNIHYISPWTKNIRPFRFWKEVGEWRKHVGCVIKDQLANQLFGSYIEDRDIQSKIWEFL